MRLRPAKPSPFASPSQLPGELRRASALMARKQWEEAGTLLKDIARRFPNSKEARLMLLEVARETDDLDLLEETAEQLAQSLPDDPMIQLMSAQVLARSGYEAWGRKLFWGFLNRWPYHSEGNQVRQMLRELEADLIPQLDATGLQGESGFDLAALNDEMRYRIAHGEYARAEETGRTLLARKPHYSPALNNLSRCRFLQGNLAGAITTIRSVLEFAPDNVHALAGLAHYLLLEGEDKEARDCARRLRASTASADDRYIKEAETYSFLGDDAAVIDVYRRALAAEHDDAEDLVLLHMVAVAYSRSGQKAEAERLWTELLEEEPEDALIQENLEDSRLPVGERYGAWAFPFSDWVPYRLVQELVEILGPEDEEPEEDIRTQQEVRQFVAKHPMFVHVLPHLLDRGGPFAQDFALELAGCLCTPETLETLNAFAFSKSGPDIMRFQAATLVTQEGLLEPGPVAFWIQGAWQQTMMMGFAITGEPIPRNHSPRVQKLLERGMEALHAEDFVEAEKRFKEALQSEPDAPDLRNNLAAVYSRQDRDEEYKEAVLNLYDDYPDYFFARINMAELWLRDDNPEMATQVIKPLLTYKRLHFSEFRSLASVQIKIAVLRKSFDDAEHWLHMWEAVEKHPAQEEWRNRIALYRQLLGLSGRRKKRK